MKTLRLIIVAINLLFILLFYLVEDLSVFFFLVFTVFFVFGYFSGKKYALFSIHALMIAGSSILPAIAIILFAEVTFHISPNDLLVSIRILLAAITLSISSFFISRSFHWIIPSMVYRNSLFAGIVLLVGTAIINFYNSALQLSMLGLSYLVVSLFLFHRTKNRMLIQALVLFAPYLVLIILPALIFAMPKAYPSFFVVPFSILSGWVLALLFIRKRFVAFIFTACISAVFVVFYYFAMLNWLSYLYLDKNPHVDSVKLQTVLTEAGIISEDENHNSINSETLGSSIKVVYFFTQYCGGCFQKMPELEALHQEFLDDHRVEIIAVNIQASYTDTLFDFAALYHSKAYTFPYRTVGPDHGATVMEQLNIRVIPHVMVIDGSFRTLHVGGFQSRDVYVIGNTKRVIRNNLLLEY
jgi:thiol-disulfide isomerase/thioredoxin